MMHYRTITWDHWIHERPGLAGCPANGLLGVSLDWDGDELVCVAGLLRGGGEVVLVDLTKEPRAILSVGEVDDLVRAAVMALPGSPA